MSTQKSSSQDPNSMPTVKEVIKNGRPISRTVTKAAQTPANTVARPGHKEAATTQDAQENGQMPKGSLHTTASGAADDSDNKDSGKLGESAEHEADKVKKSACCGKARGFLAKSKELMSKKNSPLEKADDYVGADGKKTALNKPKEKENTLNYKEINKVKTKDAGSTLDYSKMGPAKDDRPGWKKKMDMGREQKKRGLVLSGKVKKSVEDDIEKVEEEAKKMAQERSKHSKSLAKAAATKNPNDLSNMNPSRQQQAMAKPAQAKASTGINKAGIAVAQNAAAGGKQMNAGMSITPPKPPKPTLAKAEDKFKGIKDRYKKAYPKDLATTKPSVKQPPANGRDGGRHNDGAPALTKSDHHDIRPETFVDKEHIDYVDKSDVDFVDKKTLHGK